MTATDSATAVGVDLPRVAWRPLAMISGAVTVLLVVFSGRYGPHRDELVLGLSELPVKGYASHGESWSYALALRLASYELLKADGGEPVLVLDDVFAELDEGRRDRLAELVAGAEQVLVTAAVPADVPEARMVPASSR